MWSLGLCFLICLEQMTKLVGLFALQSEALPRWNAKGGVGHIGGPWECDLFWFPCLESWMVTFGDTLIFRPIYTSTQGRSQSMLGNGTFSTMSHNWATGRQDAEGWGGRQALVAGRMWEVPRVGALYRGL